MTYRLTPTTPAPTDGDELYRQWREVSDRIDAEDAAARAARAPAALIPDHPTIDPLGRGQRHDGWTPDRQRRFLQAIADGEIVERACAMVGMSATSAYSFRQRAAGQPFALGWRAANLLARERVADRLMTRALQGQTETVTRPDGSVIERHRFDNRTALALLNRLDRLAEQAPADPAAAAQAEAARLVAQDFEPFLQLLEQDRGPAAAGLFLARRTGLTGAPEAAPQLEPVLALARADAFARTGAALPAEVDASDLDVARRATWTADQWARAEAAGLLRVAPLSEVEGAPAPTGDSAPAAQHPQLIPDEQPSIWWDDRRGEYRTSFPAPPGEERKVDAKGRYGVDDYERTLTDEELALIEAADERDTAEERENAAAERDAYFAALAARLAAAKHAAAPAEEDHEAGEGAAPPSVH